MNSSIIARGINSLKFIKLEQISLFMHFGLTSAFQMLYTIGNDLK